MTLARHRTGTQLVKGLEKGPVDRALAISQEHDLKGFYETVNMRNPSRSYWIRANGRLHSLKAVTALAVRDEKTGVLAKDFHAQDAAKRLEELGYEIVHVDVAEDEALERRWINSLRAARHPAFRARLFSIYSGCPISKCAFATALEAAHVVEVKDGGSDKASNGILLRADLHKLFDSNLLAIDPMTGKVACHSDCKADYDQLLRNATFVPPTGGPSLAAFGDRWSKFQKRIRQ